MIFVHGLIQDLRFGLRRLRKNSGACIPGGFDAALGIAANVKACNVVTPSFFAALRQKIPKGSYEFWPRKMMRVGTSVFPNSPTLKRKKTFKGFRVFDEPIGRPLTDSPTDTGSVTRVGST